LSLLRTLLAQDDLKVSRDPILKMRLEETRQILTRLTVQNLRSKSMTQVIAM